MNWEVIQKTMGLVQAPKRVLVVEDDLGFLSKLSDVLVTQGHVVTQWVGADEIVDGALRGTLLNGEHEGVAVADIDAFFLDHYFLSKTLNGERLLRALREHTTVPIMGMSSDSGANQRMLNAGATLTLRKADFRRTLPS